MVTKHMPLVVTRDTLKNTYVHLNLQRYYRHNNSEQVGICKVTIYLDITVPKKKVNSRERTIVLIVVKVVCK